MNSTRNPGRVAGIFYLLLLGSPLRLIYIPNHLIVSGNAGVTATNIAAHQTLFRFGIIGDLFTAVMGIFLVLALYRLFVGVDREVATVMVILGLMVTPIYFLNTLNDAAALLFAHGAGFLSVFDPAQRQSFVMIFLRLHDHGVLVNEIFWGLWLFPFGLLVYRSRFLPRILGVWLMLNCCAYVVHSTTGLLVPQFAGTVWRIVFPLTLGELGIMLWLLIKGARPPALEAVQPTRSAPTVA